MYSFSFALSLSLFSPSAPVCLSLRLPPLIPLSWQKLLQEAASGETRTQDFRLLFSPLVWILKSDSNQWQRARVSPSLAVLLVVQKGNRSCRRMQCSAGGQEQQAKGGQQEG